MANLAVQDTWMDASLVVHQVQQIQEIYTKIMKPGIHYGPAFPGSDKPTLLQPGAELLGVVFRIDLQHETEIIDAGNGHREYRIKATAYNLLTGDRLGSGVGSASTMESKYRYRHKDLVCPKCQATTIIKGKKEYGGGWVCWKTKGGCGAKFTDDDQLITKQMKNDNNRIENPDIADVWNIVYKMAKKRADVDCIKTVTAASAFFTQDAEDFIKEEFKDVSRYEPSSDIIDAEEVEEVSEPDNGQSPRKTLYDIGDAIAARVPALRKFWEEKRKLKNSALQAAVNHMKTKEKAFLHEVAPTEEELNQWQDVIVSVYGPKSEEVHSFEKCRRQEQWTECRDIFGEAEITQQAKKDEEKNE